VAISYWTIPAKINVGQPFMLELAACPKRGGLRFERVRLDAHMPEHRHGMNYRALGIRLRPRRRAPDAQRPRGVTHFVRAA